MGAVIRKNSIGGSVRWGTLPRTLIHVFCTQVVDDDGEKEKKNDSSRRPSINVLGESKFDILVLGSTDGSVALQKAVELRDLEVCIKVAARNYDPRRYPDTLMISRFSIVTLVFFIISIILVIHPFSFPIRLPYIGRRRVSLNLTTAPILTIALLWAAQCLGPTQIRDGIVGTDGVKPYNILILFFSLAYMAITLDITGILQAAAFWVSNKGGSHGWKLYFYFYVMLTILSVVLGNDPVILSGTVFLVYYTNATSLEPTPWLMAEFAAANTASMVLFLGNPTNVVICEGFLINNVAFTAYTILPFLACIVTCFTALALQFRDAKYIPRKLQKTGYLNPRGVLRDPVGAWVGSILLGSCLVVIIVVSFFNVDVWMITLPFAVAKFIWDLSWDHFRYVTGRIPRAQQPEEGQEKDGSEAGASNAASSDDPMLSEFKRAMTLPGQGERKETFNSTSPTLNDNLTGGAPKESPSSSPGSTSPDVTPDKLDTIPEKSEQSNPVLFPNLQRRIKSIHRSLLAHFPTFFIALPRLPFGLVPFAFSQFILIEALDHQGWIDVFARWLAIASKGEIHPCIWLVGVLGVVLCNIAGTNIGATILLTKIVRAAQLSSETTRAAGIALAIASNIGAVSFTFSASLAGLLWKTILEQKGIKIKQRTFAFWNLLPIFVMTGVGLGIVSAEMAVLYR
uniref:Citrate transporter-like domain-containing protein n=2 Tax=Moniliophthora roreri TaxID=221103 RepID=A0A0W0EVF1_MONRR